MARILKISQLEAKKRALVAECEIYREALGLEVRNLRLYSTRVKRRFHLLSVFPWSLLLPAAGAVFKMRRGRRLGEKLGLKWPGLLRAGLMGFRLFRQYGPQLQTIIAQQFAQQFAQQPAPTPAEAEETTPAANI